MMLVTQSMNPVTKNMEDAQFYSTAGHSFMAPKLRDSKLIHDFENPPTTIPDNVREGINVEVA